MINRTLIRLKIVQLLYAYYQNGGKGVGTAEKELLFSLSKAYDLYHYMLLLIVSVTRHARRQVEDDERRNRAAHIEGAVSHRLADNRFVEALSRNRQLEEFRRDKRLSWDGDLDYVQKLYADITRSDFYAEYVAREGVTWEDDREVWRKIYKNLVMRDERVDDILEGQSLYWNDDRGVVDTFVLKTIKRMTEEDGAEFGLMPEYKDEGDMEFATRLFRRAIANDEYYRSLIGGSSRNWDFSRLAYIDVVIMQAAIAEMLSFPQIPISVTINEYVEIAKYYSTPKSAGYVNGIIDNVAKTLIRENKLNKTSNL